MTVQTILEACISNISGPSEKTITLIRSGDFIALRRP